MPENHKLYGQWNKDRIIDWYETVYSNTYEVIFGVFFITSFGVKEYSRYIILK